MKTQTKALRRCAECRDGDHENYDDDVRLTTVRDPDSGRIALRAYLCGEHRAARRDDGYGVIEE
jgi:hypothetical protein